MLKRKGAVRSMLKGLAHRFSRGAQLDAPSREFVAYCRKKFPKTPREGKPLILVHHCLANPTILAYAHVLNAVARQHGAVLGSFGFARSDRPVEELYKSFGAPVMLGPTQLKPWKKRADAIAAEIFAGLRTKRDVVNIHIEGISLGDLIYDSYLRYYLCPTVDMADPRLRDTISRAFQIFFASKKLLDAHRITAVFTDHAVYMDGGILARMALARGIPVQHVTFNPISVVPLDPELFAGVPDDPTGRPLGSGSCKLILPYHRFAEIFRQLPAENHDAYRAQGRAKLEARLSGNFDFRVLPGGSAYKQSDMQGVLADTGRPRILVMLHDFCDAPHAYRDLLFADHYEWTCWLLDRASQTDFDWYVKPHPNSGFDPAKAQVNERVLGELRERFPKIHFLPDGVSNLQLLQEGITALFTGYGTAAHEFAYRGIPTVNAGDNPHINYGFTLHPRSIAELAELVAKAGSLTLQIDKRQIEEYAYLRFVHFYDPAMHPVQFVPPGFADSPEAFSKIASSEVLTLVGAQTPETEALLESYLKELFTKRQRWSGQPL